MLHFLFYCDSPGVHDTREYALKQIEGSGISMSACREIAVSAYVLFVCNVTVAVVYAANFVRYLCYVFGAKTCDARWIGITVSSSAECARLNASDLPVQILPRIM